MKAARKIELLLLMSIIIVLLFKVMSAKKTIALPQALLLFVAVIVATYMLLFSKVLESFEDVTPAEMVLHKAVMEKMTVFLASDSAASFVPGNKDWQNISEDPVANDANALFHFTTKNNRPPEVEHSNGMIATGGIPTKDLVIVGPPSSELGYTGEGDFTIFWYSMTNSIPDNTNTPLFIIKGDSMNSSISIKVALDTTASGAGVEKFADAPSSATATAAAAAPASASLSSNPIRIVVQHSDDEPATAKTIYTNSSIKDPHFLLDKSLHLYMLVRDQNALRLYVDDNEVPLFNGSIKHICALTNSRMVINPDGSLDTHGWDANMYFFGIYNKALSSVDRANLNKFINHRMVMNQTVYNDLSDQYTKTNKAIAKMKACPFDGQSFCTSQNECGLVTDWSQQGVLADPKNANCLKKVITYCNQDGNMNKPECLYWVNSTTQQVNAIAASVASQPSGPIAPLVNAVRQNAPLVSGPAMAGVATALNDALANANASATNTANRTASVLQSVLDSSTGTSMDPVVYRMIQNIVSDNQKLAVGNAAQAATQSPSAAMVTPNSVQLAQLRTVGANLNYGDIAAGLLPTIGSLSNVALPQSNAITASSATASSATASASATAAATRATASNVSASNAVRATFENGSNVDSGMYNAIMSKYNEDIKKKESGGILGALTSIFG